MKLLQIIGVFFLFATSFGALYGGYGLIVDPSGQGLHLQLSYLEHSPFNDFLIPGWILFLVIGLMGLIVLFAIINRMKNYAFLQMGYGILLTGWIGIQVLMLEFTYYLHFIFGFIGIFLLITGLLMKRRTEHVSEKNGI